MFAAALVVLIAAGSGFVLLQPDPLAGLVPELLPALPLDYMNGRRLIFRCISASRFALYSSGENERDDDGAGDDIVWPEPEPEESTSKASEP
jgi:hypothetical protein